MTKTESSKPAQEERITLKTYCIVNLLFWGVCILQYAVLKWWLGNIEGISFFFFALAAGLTFISTFDVVSERFFGDGENIAGENSPEPEIEEEVAEEK